MFSSPLSQRFRRSQWDASVSESPGVTVTESEISVTLFDAKVVFEAVLITGLVVASLFAFTLQNKRDFSVGYASMGSLLMVLLWAGIFQVRENISRRTGTKSFLIPDVFHVSRHELRHQRLRSRSLLRLADHRLGYGHVQILPGGVHLCMRRSVSGHS